MNHSAPIIQDAIIVACYFIFALQLAIAAKGRMLTTRGGRAVLALMVVFIVCAITGYLSHAIEFLAPYSGAMHWVLAGASVCLVVSNQAVVIARMFRDD